MPVTNRLITLFTVLSFDTDNNYKILTPGIRICINQERAFLMGIGHEDDFSQPEIVESKIKFITEQLRLRGETRIYKEYARTQLKEE